MAVASKLLQLLKGGLKGGLKGTAKLGAEAAGMYALKSLIGDKNARSVTSAGRAIGGAFGLGGRGGSSGGVEKRSTQSAMPAFKSAAGGGLPPNASLAQILNNTNQIERETLQAVRLQSAKMDEINDTLDDVKYGIENLNKELARAEDRRAKARAAGEAGGAAAGGKSEAGELGNILKLLLGAEGIGLAGLGLKKMFTRYGPKVKTPDAKEFLTEPEVAEKALTEEEKAAAKLEGKVAGKEVAKLGAEEAAKLSGKVLAKKIPILSLLVGGGLAINDLIEGDYTGAALELLSGIAATVPVWGTAASFGLDAINVGRGLLPSASAKVVDKSKLIDANMLTITAREVIFEAEKIDFGNGNVMGGGVAGGGGGGGGGGEGGGGATPKVSPGVGGVGSGRALGGMDAVAGDVISSAGGAQTVMPSTAASVQDIIKGAPSPGAGAVQMGTAMGAISSLVPVKTKSGKIAQVAAPYAKNFQGLINDLEATGYSIKDISGYSNRANVNDPSKMSAHAYGMAIDINPNQNPNRKDGRLITDMPSNIAQIAAKNGLGWGGNFSSVKDPMHFSALPNERTGTMMAAGNMTGDSISKASVNVSMNAEGGGGNASAPAGPRPGIVNTSGKNNGPSIFPGVVPDARPSIDWAAAWDHYTHSTHAAAAGF